eukprot:TRINITY_DN16291_c0_g1_i2.p1 TRINITY_DN16291_c0_g1~~TRINITY_DN16291_c0_g1_i2.p1  ORF type:complete len:190 (-),score=11.21 TRINITY_DN16291_c0_g1_i2:532-1101(-)
MAPLMPGRTADLPSGWRDLPSPDIAALTCLPVMIAAHCVSVIFKDLPLEICVFSRSVCGAVVFYYVSAPRTTELFVMHFIILMIAVTSILRFATYMPPPGKAYVLAHISIALDAFIAVCSLKVLRRSECEAVGSTREGQGGLGSDRHSLARSPGEQENVPPWQSSPRASEEQTHASSHAQDSPLATASV